MSVQVSRPRVIIALILFGVFLVGLVVIILFQKGIFRGANKAQKENVSVVAEHQAVLVSLSQNASDAERKQYEELVKRLARESAVLALSKGCTMDPLVLKLSSTSILKIANEDDVAHVVAFEDQNFFSVSAKSTREIDLQKVFGKGEGIYRYRCKDASKPSAGVVNNGGVLYIVK